MAIRVLYGSVRKREEMYFYIKKHLLSFRLDVLKEIIKENPADNEKY